jgi:hypothetical protein
LSSNSNWCARGVQPRPANQRAKRSGKEEEAREHFDTRQR